MQSQPGRRTGAASARPAAGLGGVGEVGAGMGFSERAAAALEVAGGGLSGPASGILLLSSSLTAEGGF